MVPRENQVSKDSQDSLDLQALQDLVANLVVLATLDQREKRVLMDLQVLRVRPDLQALQE